MWFCVRPAVQTRLVALKLETAGLAADGATLTKLSARLTAMSLFTPIPGGSARNMSRSTKEFGLWPFSRSPGVVKKMSNKEWQSPADPDSRIAKMKDGSTHMAYKAEHVVDLESNLVLSAEIYHADQADSATMEQSLATAQLNLMRAGSEQEIEEAAADKGYHKVELLAAT